MITDWQSPQLGLKTKPVSFIIIKCFMWGVSLPYNSTSYVNGDGEVVAGQGIVAHRPLHITSQVRSDQGQMSVLFSLVRTIWSMPHCFHKIKAEAVILVPSLGFVDFMNCLATCRCDLINSHYLLV